MITSNETPDDNLVHASTGCSHAEKGNVLIFFYHTQKGDGL